MNATDSPGDLIDRARRARRNAQAARSLVATLRVAPHEVAIERRSGVLGWLQSRGIPPQPVWETIDGLESGVLQDALFIIRDQYEAEARRLESRVTVKPEEIQ